VKQDEYFGYEYIDIKQILASKYYTFPQWKLKKFLALRHLNGLEPIVLIKQQRIYLNRLKFHEWVNAHEEKKDLIAKEPKVKKVYVKRKKIELNKKVFEKERSLILKSMPFKMVIKKIKVKEKVFIDKPVLRSLRRLKRKVKPD